MERSQHCELCDSQEISLVEGSTCKLTDFKPEFIKSCSNIELNEKFIKKLKLTNVELHDHNRKITITYIYIVLMLVVGVLVISGGYIIGKYGLDSDVISTVPIIIMGAGVAPLALAFGTLNKYRQSLIVLRDRKSRIDKVLDVYNIKYDIKTRFGKSYHGTQEVDADLKIS